MGIRQKQVLLSLVKHGRTSKAASAGMLRTVQYTAASIQNTRKTGSQCGPIFKTTRDFFFPYSPSYNVPVALPL